MTKKEIQEDKEREIFAQNGLHYGKYFASKSKYCAINPNNKVIFNSYIYTDKKRLIWFGDIDLTIELQALDKVRRLLKIKEFHIFTESDGCDGYGSRNKIILNKDGLFQFIRFATNYTYKI